MADGGGSNGSRARLWKLELQRLADDPDMSIWVSHEVIVNVVAATTTCNGLKVQAEIDPTPYPKGVKVTDTEFATIQIARDDSHGEWNYVISPNR
jgi:hypothetical protein